jgi:hypothetical protein
MSKKQMKSIDKEWISGGETGGKIKISGPREAEYKNSFS